MSSTFEKLYEIKCEPYFQKVGTFSGNYLPWPDAWMLLKKAYPDSIVEFKKFDGLPYQKTELGYFVEVSITIEGKTEIETYGVTDSSYKTVQTPDTRDITDNQQRAFVKCCARHGLGLSAWEKDTKIEEEKCTEAQAKMLYAKLESKGYKGSDLLNILNQWGYASTDEIPKKRVNDFVKLIEDLKKVDPAFTPDIKWGKR